MATKTKKPVKNSLKETVMEPSAVSSTPKANPKFFTYLVIVALLGVALFLAAKKYRGWVIAAMVNTQPVTRWELNKALMSQYGKAALDQLIADKLLRQLAAENKITVTSDDTKKELDDLTTRLGGKEALQSSMDRFGIDQNKLNDEIYTVLLQKKLSAKLFKIEVTDDEVNKYYQDNKTLFAGKKFDDVKADIRANLEQQKLQEQFSTWFSEQQKKAQIKTFI